MMTETHIDIYALLYIHIELYSLQRTLLLPNLPLCAQFNIHIADTEIAK